jgi:Icc protein
MKLVWLSDLHFEFLPENLVRAFLGQVIVEAPDVVVITGDISNGRMLQLHLELIAKLLPYPVYFELGNHDFYQSDFVQVNAVALEICALHSNLIELGHGEIIPLGKDTALVGHRGWADGRAGIGSRSNVRLNDHQYITDLRLPSSELFSTLNLLGDQSADYIRTIVPKALEKAQNLFIATHVPPFPEASLYQNKPSDPNFAPHFVNVAMGRAILEMAKGPASVSSISFRHQPSRRWGEMEAGRRRLQASSMISSTVSWP